MNDLRYRWRMRFLSAAVIAALAGLSVRLVFLHLGPNEALRRKIVKTRRVERRLRGGRGRIFDRRGEIMALDVAVKNVCADPKLLHESGSLQAVALRLARLLEMEPAVLLARLDLPRRRFAYVKRHVPPEVGEMIRRMKLQGVFFQDDVARYYPHDQLMCHVVGFVNMERVGSAGVEQKLDRYLKGTPGLLVSERDGRRRELYDRRTVEVPASAGADVYLTLDVELQYMVEKALDEAVSENAAKGAWAIVERVRTGEILAMASRPAFNPNEFRKSDPESMRNRAIAYVYEPGSTFKLAVIAAALNEGLVTADEVIDCENGVWMYRGRPLRDYHAHGRLSVADVLKKSSNIGAAKIALRLGPERLDRYLRAFGFGRRTGVGLPGEQAGILHPPRAWSALSITRIAMGHEVAVTALQMLEMACAIANGGYLMRPYVVRRVVDWRGRELMAAEPRVVARPIREATADLMRRLMVRVTEPGGTGWRAALAGYRVAGKTGTAQKPVRGGYSRTADVASFVGFLPAEDPELGIIVVVDEPQPRHTGGAVAAPVFRKIAEQAVRYLDIRSPGGRGGGLETDT